VTEVNCSIKLCSIRIFLVMTAAWSSISPAATFNVDTFEDSAALQGGIDVVNVPAGTYHLTLNGTGGPETEEGDLDLTDSVLITGAGMDVTLIDAGGNQNQGFHDRVFHVHAGTEASISHLTVTRGWLDGMGG
jgi:hypothetical protein